MSGGPLDAEPRAGEADAGAGRDSGSEAVTEDAATGRHYDGGLGSRRALRERVLSLLYEAESKSCPIADVLDGLPLTPDPFVDDLARGVGAHQEAIDEHLAAHARGWTLARMPATDRAILRMATYELGWCPEVPTAVAISEAVELAKSYSTDDSGRFVNGMLSAIAPEVRPDRT